MVGAIANSAVPVRPLDAAPTLAAAWGAEGPLGAEDAGDTAGWAIAGTRTAAGLASPGLAGDVADPGETGLSGASVPGREGTAATGGTPGLPGIPGEGPPIHMRVLAGETGLFVPGPPATDAATTIALPHAWQTMTGRAASGLMVGSGARQ
jgi:hypothetical protein